MTVIIDPGLILILVVQVLLILHVIQHIIVLVFWKMHKAGTEVERTCIESVLVILRFDFGWLAAEWTILLRLEPFE